MRRQAKPVRKWSNDRSKIVDGIGAFSSSRPAPKTERSRIAQRVTVAPPESESMTVWSTVLRVTRRRSTPVHSTHTLPPNLSSIVGGIADGGAATPRREAAVTRDEDDFATA